MLQEKLPAQLQDIVGSDQGLALGMFGRGTWWLFLDVSPVRPGIFFQPDKAPWPSQKKQKPVGLFLNSHAKGMFLTHVDLLEDYGRVIQLVFSNTMREVIVEMEVIPRTPNIIVNTSDGKKISWFKPRNREAQAAQEINEARSFTQLIKEWRDSFFTSNRKDRSGSASGGDLLSEIFKKRQKDLEKKKRALAEIEKTLDPLETQRWFELGELLKWKKVSELQKDWEDLLDSRLTMAENRERAFAKGKQLELKRAGTLKRKEIILKEIAELESDQVPKSGLVPKPKSKVPVIKEAKLRTKTLDSGYVAHLGKSAADNMKLLRQSQPWDMWIHLRDYPSSHAILHRNKNQNLPMADIEIVAIWLAEQSLGTKQISAGQKIDVVYTECRFVKPIKGDKLGRVHYQSEKVLTVRLQKN